MHFSPNVFASCEAMWHATRPDKVDFAPLNNAQIDAIMIKSMLERRGIASEIEVFDAFDRLTFDYRGIMFFIRHYKSSKIRNYIELVANWAVNNVWCDMEMIMRANRINLHQELVRASFSTHGQVFGIEIPIALSDIPGLDRQLDTYVDAILDAAERKF